MSNFDPNAIIRGAQLTVVGAIRALQNPGLFKYEHYRQAVIAVAAGALIRLLIAVPIAFIKASIWLVLSVAPASMAPTTLAASTSSTASTTPNLFTKLDFVAESVLQLPFFLMSLMRYMTPTLDDLFMDSLNWVDLTYAKKHKSDDPRTLRATYYPNLRLYSSHGAGRSQQPTMDAGLVYLKRYARRMALSLALYLFSYVPVVGRFVLPAASFYAFNQAVGPIPATAVFGVGVFLPKTFLIVFLQSYFASRSLMRDLLEPYFSRIRFTPDQKRRWFRDREGILFGFAVGFYIFLKIPLLGVLIYGIAEASTAYLITKITDPPPPPTYAGGYAETQTQWQNKVEFLTLPLENLDAYNISLLQRERTPSASGERAEKGPSGF